MLVGDLLTTREAAELLRVSHWTISAWLSKKRLPRTKAGGRTLISKSDLEAFLRKSGAQNIATSGHDILVSEKTTERGNP